MKLSPEEIEAQLNAVRQDYLRSLLEKRDAIITKRSSLQDSWDQAAYHDLYLIVHSLAGSAETFGLAQVSHAARRLVNKFKHYGDEHSLPAKAFAHCHDEFEQLLACLNTSLEEIYPAK